MIQHLTSPRTLRAMLPVLSLLILLAAIFYIQPRAMSYFGLKLLFNLVVPIALATLAQMMIITVNDLDLSVGTYVGFVACVGATFLNETPLIGVVILLSCILVYALLGALVHLRNLPSIVVTLGMSFVWLGLAVIVLPTPGGKSPGWIRDFMTLQTPYVPFAIIICAVVAFAVHFFLMRSSFGTVLRGAGGNPRSVERSGWSLLKLKMTMCAGRVLRCAFRALPHRPDDLCRRQYCLALHAVVDCRCHSRRWRVCWRARLADRCGRRRNDADPGRFVPDIPAYFP